MFSVQRLRRFFADQRGGVSVMLVLMMIPMIALLGMAVEGSSWFMTKRAMQNAADSAAMAASTNACDAAAPCHLTNGSPTYDFEAKAVTERFGFKDGQANVVVTATNTATCPDGTAGCYGVRIAKIVPISLVSIVGFHGSTTLAGQPAIEIASVSIAKGKGPPEDYCMTALSSSPTAISFNGAHTLNLTTCDLFVPNGGAECTNQVGNAVRYSDVSVTGKSNKDCGTERQTTATFTDNYAGLKSLIPDANAACPSGFPQASNKDVVTTPANLISGALSFTASSAKCGDVQLTGDVTVTTDSVLVINNGRLDLAGHTLSTANGAHLTIVFSGTSDTSVRHYPMSSVNGGLLNFSDMQSGDWSGVAIYQNPDLPSGSGVDMTSAGNNPQWDITGLIYAPKSNVTIQGAINHATAGFACIAFVTYTLNVGGTGDIFAKPTLECDRAQVNVPKVPGSETRQALVQ